MTLQTVQVEMSVKIRLKRVGSKNAPFYRVVVADSRERRDGRFIEEIGSYRPIEKGENFNLKMERIEYWLGVGAQPTDTARSLIRRARRNAEAVATAEPEAASEPTPASLVG